MPLIKVASQVNYFSKHDKAKAHPIATMQILGADETGTPKVRVTYHHGPEAGHEPKAHTFKSTTAAEKAITEYMKPIEAEGEAGHAHMARRSAAQVNARYTQLERDELRAELDALRQGS